VRYLFVERIVLGIVCEHAHMWVLLGKSVLVGVCVLLICRKNCSPQ
jgi:hypothetical protein